MKMSKKFRAIASAALISAMVMSMNGMTALASETTSIDEVPFTKKVTADDNTYAPDAKFYFYLTTGAAGKITDTGEFGDTGNVVKAGIDGGLELESNYVVFTPEDTAPYSKSGKIKVHKSSFDYNETTKTGGPGIYHYVLTEVGRNNYDQYVNEINGVEEADYDYAGIKYDETDRHLFVYVVSDDAGNLSVDGVICTVNNEITSGENLNPPEGVTPKDDLEFINDYGFKEDSTHNVVITKKVTGSQGNRSALFSIKVTIEADEENEKFKVVKNVNGSSADESGEDEDLVCGVKEDDGTTNTKKAVKTYNISDNGTITIYGLTSGDKVTVDEDPYDSEGYTTTYKEVKEENAESKLETVKIEGNDKMSFNVKSDDAQVSVINDKNPSTPTGIVMTFGPYVLLLALAGVFAVMFLRKKREDF